MMEKEGTEPNLIMLNVLINAFGNAGKHMEALSIYHHIKESVCIISNSCTVHSTSNTFLVKYYAQLVEFVL